MPVSSGIDDVIKNSPYFGQFTPPNDADTTRIVVCMPTGPRGRLAAGEGARLVGGREGGG